MKIRNAEPGDATRIASLHRASILELCSSNYTEAQLQAWAGPKKPTDYAMAINSDAVFVAEVGTEILGFSLFDAEEAELRALYVHPAHVGRGAGTALLKAVEQSALSAGFRRMGLHATLNSSGFYERLGYENLGPSENPLPTGEKLPCVRMEKELISGDAG